AIPPDSHGNNDLLQRRIAGTLPNSINRALDMPGTGGDCRKRVGYRQPQIVVTMRRNGNVLNAAYTLPEGVNQIRELSRGAVAHRVRDIHGGRASIDYCLNDFAEKIRISAGRIFRGKLHIAA